MAEANVPQVFSMRGAYEATDTWDRALSLWTPPIQTPDDEIIPGKDVMEGRVRDMQRNDGYIRAGIRAHKDYIVGDTYVFTSKPNLKVLGLDGEDEWAREFSEELEAKFSLWAESLDCWPDVSQTMTLTEMVRLAVGIYTASGEFLAVSEWVRDRGRPYSTSFNIIDIDRLRTPPEYEGDPMVRGGIRISKTGKPLEYYITDAHPRDQKRFMDAMTFRRVRAKLPFGRPRVVHIKETHRPGQTRGLAQLTAGLKELKTLKKFRDVTLQNAVVNASFAATIESELPTEAVMTAIGGGNVPQSVVDYAQTYLAAIGKYVANSQHIQIDGVKIPHLYPGTKLNLQPAGKIGGVGQDFEKSLLRYLASILDVSYEELTRDYTATNYSSAKAAMNQTQKFMKSRKRFVADRFANVILRNWFEEVANLPPSRGGFESLRFSKAPNIYEGMNLQAYIAGEWLGATAGQLDELKETQAAILRIKLGLTTREREIRRLGGDWRDTLSQIRRERDEMQRLGLEDLTGVQDNSLNAASGSPRDMKDADGGLKTPEQVKEETE